MKLTTKSRRQKRRQRERKNNLRRRTKGIRNSKRLKTRDCGKNQRLDWPNRQEKDKKN